MCLLGCRKHAVAITQDHLPRGQKDEGASYFKTNILFVAKFPALCSLRHENAVKDTRVLTRVQLSTSAATIKTNHHYPPPQ